MASLRDNASPDHVSNFEHVFSMTQAPGAPQYSAPSRRASSSVHITPHNAFKVQLHKAASRLPAGERRNHFAQFMTYQPQVLNATSKFFRSGSSLTRKKAACNFA